MNSEEIRNVENELWEAADELRANSKLTAAEYKDPVLGLILLRFAENRFNETFKKIKEKIPLNPRTKKKEITKEHFLGEASLFLREESKFEYLATLPDSSNISEAVNKAMMLIEEDNKDLQGILPKNYQSFDGDLLRGIIRIFNRESIQKIAGDVFGRIYEFFLMKFSMSGAGAQEGGEFFTPPSLVQLIVNSIEPNKGVVYDPACGSGGMFTQTAHFINKNYKNSINEEVSVFGSELKTNSTKLAKMNLAIHGLEGKILEANAYYSDPHKLLGKCDFVMANPPFNVDKVDKKKEFVTKDKRLPFGLPTSDNANYLWIQYFYSYLNKNGRAGFVMTSSATDAGGSEKKIRQKLIETGSIEAVISIANNFFYTKSLPCHIWILNKKKINKDSILFIDARDIYRKVSQTLNDFSNDHLEGISNIIKSYRGEDVDFKKNEWLKANFKNAKYEDIKSLCKIVTLNEIKENKYVLTPGTYVGQKKKNYKSLDYRKRILEINTELNKLNKESDKLFQLIKKIKI
ncbi:type I restriction-modification system subunit M [Candidatus Pelagibacter sp.]|nr:type I restriction-modification system subunit M [Candidatus Pelagibacter sp.]